MDIFIAGVILIAAVAWDSSQAILDAVSLVPAETVASHRAIGHSRNACKRVRTRATPHHCA